MHLVKTAKSVPPVRPRAHGALQSQLLARSQSGRELQKPMSRNSVSKTIPRGDTLGNTNGKASLITLQHARLVSSFCTTTDLSAASAFSPWDTKGLEYRPSGRPNVGERFPHQSRRAASSRRAGPARTRLQGSKRDGDTLKACGSGKQYATDGETQKCEQKRRIFQAAQRYSPRETAGERTEELLATAPRAAKRGSIIRAVIWLSRERRRRCV